MYTTLLKLVKLFQLVPDNYGTNIRKYIISHNPKNVADIERLTLQYQRGKHKEVWL